MRYGPRRRGHPGGEARRVPVPGAERNPAQGRSRRSTTTSTATSASGPSGRCGGRSCRSRSVLPSRLVLRGAGDDLRDRRGRARDRFDPEALRLRQEQDRPRELRGLGFAGFRVHFPVNTPEVQGRGAGVPGRQLFPRARAGTSATACRRAGWPSTPPGRGEEFPRFVEFWIERPAPAAKELTIYALLDSPRAAGAYRFVLRPGATTVARRRRAALPARERRQARHRAADQHVLLRREPAAPVATTTGPRCTTPTACPSAGGRRVDLAPAGQSEAAAGDLVRAHQSGGLRPDAARPRVRQLPGPRGALRDAAQGVGRAEGAWGTGASSWCRFPRRTRPTTTSSRSGCPTGAEARRSRSTSGTACSGRRNARRGRRCVDAQTRRGHGYMKDADGSIELLIDFEGPALKDAANGAWWTAWSSADGNGEIIESHAYRNEVTGGWRFACA